MSFDRALAFVLAHEGGYVDHPADPGGATQRGVTQFTYDHYRAKLGLELQPVKDIADAELRAIYGSLWTRSSAGHLPWPLAVVHYDTGVNCGLIPATELLQHSLGVRVDGTIGPVTLAVAAEASPIATAQAYCDRRVHHYDHLIDRNPRLTPFRRGWRNRVNDLRTLITEAPCSTDSAPPGRSGDSTTA